MSYMIIEIKLQWKYLRLRECLIAAFNRSGMTVKDLVYTAGLSDSNDWYDVVHGNSGDTFAWDRLYHLCIALNLNPDDFLPNDMDPTTVALLRQIVKRNENG